MLLVSLATGGLLPSLPQKLLVALALGLALLDDAPADGLVHEVVLVGDGLPAFVALLGPRLAGLQVRCVLAVGHIELAVLAELGPGRAALGVFSYLIGGELLLAVLAGLLLVELLLVLLLVVDVEHLAAVGAWLDVAAAVPEVGGNFRLGELLVAVVALLGCLAHLNSDYNLV